MPGRGWTLPHGIVQDIAREHSSDSLMNESTIYYSYNSTGVDETFLAIRIPLTFRNMLPTYRETTQNSDGKFRLLSAIVRTVETDLKNLGSYNIGLFKRD